MRRSAWSQLRSPVRGVLPSPRPACSGAAAAIHHSAPAAPHRLAGRWTFPQCCQFGGAVSVGDGGPDGVPPWGDVPGTQKTTSILSWSISIRFTKARITFRRAFQSSSLRPICNREVSSRQALGRPSVPPGSPRGSVPSWSRVAARPSTQNWQHCGNVHRWLVGKDSNHVGTSLHFLIQSLQRVCNWYEDLGARSSDWDTGSWCMVRPSGTRGTGSTSVGRPIHRMSCELALEHFQDD